MALLNNYLVYKRKQERRARKKPKEIRELEAAFAIAVAVQKNEQISDSYAIELGAVIDEAQTLPFEIKAIRADWEAYDALRPALEEASRQLQSIAYTAESEVSIGRTKIFSEAAVAARSLILKTSSEMNSTYWGAFDVPEYVLEEMDFEIADIEIALLSYERFIESLERAGGRGSDWDNREDELWHKIDEAIDDYESSVELHCPNDRQSLERIGRSKNGSVRSTVALVH